MKAEPYLSYRAIGNGAAVSVDADDYDALLVLARRLRMVAMGLYKTEDDTDFASVIADSAWLEE